ncbi:MAG: pantoate--beta-alanine ligase [Chitinophagales bacterium]|nr:pantoate--beta-alanine ligase [Chitinophagales bacterium]
MKIFRCVSDWKNFLPSIKNRSIGFVPTMGALHQGHLSLVRKAKRENGFVVVSIFVNPTQFNDKEDYLNYPVTTEQDIALLKKVRCNALFLPTVQEIYPNGLNEKDPLDFGFLASTLEGEHRPGHFAGMAQVVERLLRIIEPHKLYMGLKDYQQALIVEQLIKKRNLPVQLIKCTTVREADGLAMSSRNIRLNQSSRAVAAQLSKTLFFIKRKIYSLRKENNKNVTIEEIVQKAKRKLQRFGEIELEYVEVRNGLTLMPVKDYSEKPLVALIAAKINGVRLIDNVIIS